MKWKGYDLIGFSGIFNTLFPSILCLAKRIKEEMEAKIAIGGFNTGEVGPEILKTYKFVDYIICGEGESPLLNLIHRLEEGEEPDVPNVVYRCGNKIIDGRTKNIKVFTEIPKPDFRGLDLNLYKKLSPFNKLVLPYQFIRGCPYNCSFCRFAKKQPLGINVHKG
jgi:radical SAM superfamily enzyme YgiQ (UPF0313 family)